MSHTHIRIADITDQAPSFGVDSLEARTLRTELGAETIGMTAYTVKPDRRLGFGHSHTAVEEIYLVTRGSGRFKLDDEIIDVAEGSVIHCPPAVVREWEAGPDGMDVIAFGGHVEGDGDMVAGWWTD